MGHPRQRALANLILLLAAATSCEDSPGAGDTGLPEDTLIISLSADQWQTFCTVADNVSRRPPEDECRRLAFSETRNVAEGTDADVRATCQALYNSCVRDIRPPPRRGPICSAGAPLIDCSATVGEAEACLNAISARRQQDRNNIPSCATVTAADARATAGTTEVTAFNVLLELPPCQVIQQKCMGLIR